MPTYQRFEDLPVWQEAIVLAERCEDFIETAKDLITWSKRDQLDRASLSVSNNIADGARQRGSAEMVCAAGAGPEQREGRLGPGALWAGQAATASNAAPPTNSSPSSTSRAAPPARSAPCSASSNAAPRCAISDLKSQI